MNPIFDFFLGPYEDRELSLIILEATAFFFGIASVIYAKREDIMVYPTGLVATAITTYIFFVDRLLGDMMMNFYFSIMSIYGWWNWARRKQNREFIVRISRTNTREKWIGIALFSVTLLVTFGVYKAFGAEIKTTNYVDIVTSGIFFTAMWYMANKKLESWTLWVLGDLITVPLYAYRGWGMFSLQYLIFTVLAIQGYVAWKKDLGKSPQTS
ncbi:nicotinamide riboside transporter PnuC [Flagellimonas alvinocaridis]|uniref:Nicotinamide riboside transporter PnuC n=1 Tax=Flagellimonas alvinocaridis TaxID=2530200 RepID=A0A4S8RS42_9FLAO|nr:nicotinamide riboside transporter PnuC [Allomuricauda alvinocaridis]THV61558.1 nicotinamide riboside transporter PnuC [Allomuricauda alvinocaridis]